MRRPGAAMPILRGTDQQVARARRHLLPLRSGPISHTEICCPSPPPPGRSHPAAQQDGPSSTQCSLLELLVMQRLQTSRVPVVTRLTRQSRAAEWAVGVQARRPAKMLAGLSDVPATPIFSHLGRSA